MRTIVIWVLERLVQVIDLGATVALAVVLDNWWQKRRAITRVKR